MRIINLRFWKKIRIMVPQNLIVVISSPTSSLSSLAISSSTTSFTVNFSDSDTPTSSWINWWNSWSRSTFWLWIDGVVPIHICRKYSVVGITYPIGIWKIVPYNIWSDAIFDCLLFLKASFKLDKLLPFS